MRTQSTAAVAGACRFIDSYLSKPIGLTELCARCAGARRRATDFDQRYRPPPGLHPHGPICAGLSLAVRRESDHDATPCAAANCHGRRATLTSVTGWELRLSSTAGIASWLAGVFYCRHDYERGIHGERPMFGPNGAAALHPIWSALLRGVPLALPGRSYGATVRVRF